MLTHLLISKWRLYSLSLAACLGVGVLCFAVYERMHARSSKQAQSIDDYEEPPLNEDERAYLWEVEHHGQLLSQRGFALIKTAMVEADAAALQKLLAEDFEGSTLKNPRQIRFSSEAVQVVREEDQGKGTQPLGRDDFVDQLLKYRREYGATPNVQLSLMTLAPQNRANMDGSWEGTAVLRLYGEFKDKATAEITINLRYRIPRPSEELFKSAGWLKTCAITQTLTAKSPRFLLREVARERGIDTARFHDNWISRQKISTTGGVYLCDYDRDGILDMLVTDHNGSVLYKGLPGGKFKDVSREVGLPNTPMKAVAFADLDGDGWDDLVIDGRIYANQPDGRGGRHFVDVTKLSNLRIVDDFSQVVILDYNRDGLLDLYFTSSGSPKTGSWVTGKSGDWRNNRLYRNDGNWQFTDVTEASGAAGGNRSCFTAVCLDANNDGWPDIHVINEFGNGVLLINQGNGTFREEMLVKGPGDFGTMGATAGDFDNDNNIDLYLGNMYSKAGTRVIGNLRSDAYDKDLMETMRHFVKGSQLWRNKGQLKFEAKGKEWQVNSAGWAYGPAAVDLKNDGFLDLYATAGFMSMDRTEPDG
jgi:FG-GAP-like repeat